MEKGSLKGINELNAEVTSLYDKVTDIYYPLTQESIPQNYDQLFIQAKNCINIYDNSSSLSLADKIDSVDFLVNPLEHVKEQIIKLVEEEVSKNGK